MRLDGRVLPHKAGLNLEPSKYESYEKQRPELV